ncbi:MAG: GLUG motif-containing protein [Pseudomonadota bacterium]
MRWSHRTYVRVAAVAFLLPLFGCSSSGGTDGIPLGEKADLAILGKGALLDDGSSGLSFGFVTPAWTVESTLTIVNTGQLEARNLQGGAFATRAFSYKDGAYPGTGGDCPNGGALAPGASCLLVLTFTPPGEGPFRDTLRISYEGGRQAPSLVQIISGTGKPCDPTQEGFGEGDGTSSKPFQICSLAHLQGVSANPAGYFVLRTALDLEGVTFPPIASGTNFTGNFDGNGHTISNFTYKNGTQDSVGFFGSLSNATVKNLTLANVDVEGHSSVAGLAGRVTAGTTISNCHVTGGSVSAADSAGGVVGRLDGSSVTASDSTAGVSATGGGVAGGFVGWMYGASGSISDSYATGTVSGAGSSGGFVGYIYGKATLTNCHATGSVTGGGSEEGGFAGNVYGAPGSRVSISRSYATGSTSGCSNVGGFAGRVYQTDIDNSYATGSVSAKCYWETGGFVGTVAVSTLTNSYSTGSVSGGGSYVGGFLGLLDNFAGTSTFQSVFWDTTSSGMMTSAGDANVVGKTTTEMKDQATFVGWDFDTIWTMPAGRYPALR